VFVLMTELRQTVAYAKYMELLGWDVDMLSGIYVYSKKIPLLGYFVKIQRPSKSVPLSEIEKLRKIKRTYSITVEPSSDKQLRYYQDYGFHISKSLSLPSKTIQFDLRGDLENVLKKMNPKTRYNIGLSERKGVKVKHSEDIDSFVNFWHESAKRRGFYLPLGKEIKSLCKAFGTKAHLVFAYFKSKLVAAVLLVTTKDTTHYMYAASSQVGNKYFAPTLLVWESLKLAKSLGSKTFDFEGIYDERYPLDAWKGFTRFKKGFGGKMIVYPGVLKKNYLISKILP